MQAAVWTELNVMKIKEVPIPVIAPHEVLVKVRSAGVCATDLEVYSGRFEYSRPPLILGHEIAGEVAETGGDVIGWQTGDRVVVETSIGCGHCRLCRQGSRHLCNRLTEIGASPHDGGYAQYVKVPAANLFRIPDEVSYDEAGIIESVVCPTGALMRLGVHLGETVVVYGVGPAGIAFVQGARAMGAGKIIVIGRHRGRLERTLRFGADVLIDSSAEDVRARVLEETGGDGGDLVCEAAGSADTAAEALQTVRRAGRVILYGIPTGSDVVPMPVVDIVVRQLEIHGTMGDPSVWEPLLTMVAKGQVNLRDMVNGILPLSRIEDAFAMLEDRQNKPIKLVLHPWEI